MTTRRVLIAALVFVWLGSVALAQEDDVPLSNWLAPATWTPAKGMIVSAQADLSNPVPFIPITPCRVADTRGNGFTGQYGPPALAASGTRNFTITGQCGIPNGAEAVSFNFTITNGTAAGDLRFYPAGGAVPTVSTINWTAGQAPLANAAVVPLGTGGAISVKNDSTGTVQLIIDVNGYYTALLGTTNEYFGISGTINAGGLIYAYNYSTSGGNTSGVRGVVASGGAGASGVLGEYGGSAAGYGVEGDSSSAADNAAGVEGTSGSLELGLNMYSSAGVRGEGAGGYGVIGLSDNTGVAGFHLNSSTGLPETFAILGSDNTYAVTGVGSLILSGTKSFVDPHPTDPAKQITYVALEGPEAGTYFRGRARFEGRVATIEVPEDFRAVTDGEGLSIQVTPIGGFASVYVEYLGLDQIVVRSTKDVEFYYTVNGVRRAFKDFQPIQENMAFKPRAATDAMVTGLAAEQKRILIRTGIYNEDGSVNLETAERLGWVQQWRDREAKMRAAAEAAAVKQAAHPTSAERSLQQP